MSTENFTAKFRQSISFDWAAARDAIGDPIPSSDLLPDMKPATHETNDMAFAHGQGPQFKLQGEDVLEIAGGQGKEWIWINGEPKEDLEDGTWYLSSIDGFVVHFREHGDDQEAIIYVDGYSEKLVFKIHHGRDHMDVEGKGSKSYNGSTGLLGSHALNGLRVGRDGKTLIQVLNEFSQEWQVLPGEAQLFHNYDATTILPQ
ncbi:expressed unknown protein [Seminavis robusta]|uniref:Uncharacterized protein n=1 Tax=Seminavis robusta TaxID=568900 RepID=A0A9N8HQ18_9STRA|nr:expressed unknown protein [Seminavis robusta]|eukprot:Sro1389_g268580.1 n/a (202) ;mRNA; f:23359-24220